MQVNMEIKNRAKEKGVRLWQIAGRLGISDGNFSRRLRKQLNDEEQHKIFKIIDELAELEEEDY